MLLPGEGNGQLDPARKQAHTSRHSSLRMEDRWNHPTRMSGAQSLHTPTVSIALDLSKPDAANTPFTGSSPPPDTRPLSFRLRRGDVVTDSTSTSSPAASKASAGPKWYRFFSRKKSDQEPKVTAASLSYPKRRSKSHPELSAGRGTTSSVNFASIENGGGALSATGPAEIVEERGLQSPPSPNEASAPASGCVSTEATAGSACCSAERTDSVQFPGKVVDNAVPPNADGSPLSSNNNKNDNVVMTVVLPALVGTSEKLVAAQRDSEAATARPPRPPPPPTLSKETSSTLGDETRARTRNTPVAGKLAGFVANSNNSSDIANNNSSNISGSRNQVLELEAGTSQATINSGFSSSGSVGDTWRRDSSGGDLWNRVSQDTRPAMSLGMNVLCLDIFNSRIGGGEIRQWVPAEIGEIFLGESGYAMVRVILSAYGDKKQSACLRLKDEWKRLAPLDFLSDEEISTGAPLNGAALAASRKQFKPRSNSSSSRRNRRSSLGPSASSSGTGSSTVKGGSLLRAASATDAVAGAQQFGRGNGDDSSATPRRQNSGEVLRQAGVTKREEEMDQTAASLSAALAAALAAQEGGPVENKGRTMPLELQNPAAWRHRSLGFPPGAAGGDTPVATALPPPPVAVPLAAVSDVAAKNGGGERGGGGKPVILGSGEEVVVAVDGHIMLSPLKSQSSRDQLIAVGGGNTETKATAEGGGGGRAAGQSKSQLPLWDISDPPVVGGCFDCLDCFVSSQTQLDVMKWREAEVVDIRHSDQEIEVLVHYIKWSPKWDRWISLTRQPERFAAFLSRAPQASKKDTRADLAAPPATQQYQRARSGLGSNTRASSDWKCGSDRDTSFTTVNTTRPPPARRHSDHVSLQGRTSSGTGLRRPQSPSNRNAAHGSNNGLRRGYGSAGSYPGGSGNGNSTKCSPTDSQNSEGSADWMFRDAMRRKGLSVVDVEPDGNCLFRSVSHQIFGDADRHLQVRKACVDHMSKHRARFGVFVAEDFREYLSRRRQAGVWGDDLEIRALEELFDRPIEIYSSEGEDLRPMKIDFDASELGVEIAPIKLSYHGQSHYNSVRDHSFRYPLHPRRSKDILHMREAQHAHTPRSSAASLSRARGSRAGGGLAAEVGSNPSGTESRFGGLGGGATGFSGENSSKKGGAKWRVDSSGSGGKVGVGGAREKGWGEKRGAALRTFFGGVSNRLSM